MIDNKKCILIADDEKEIRDILTLLLNAEGYHVIVAEDGQEAVDKASDDIDLFILDVNMPRLTGIMAAVELRKTYQTPIIFLTAYSGESDKVMGFSAGADDYIVKPFFQCGTFAQSKSHTEENRRVLHAGGKQGAGGQPAEKQDRNTGYHTRS